MVVDAVGCYEWSAWDRDPRRLRRHEGSYAIMWKEGRRQWGLEIPDVANRMSLSHPAAHFCALAADAATSLTI